MPELQITDIPTRAAPNSRTTKQSERFELLAVNATFDGSGAASAYLPCVEVISDSGAVVSRTFAASVAAGSSAEVTFAPFLRDPTAGGGIQFDKSPQTGDWLLVTTTGSNTATSGYGIKFDSGASGLGIYDGGFRVAEFYRNVVDFLVRNVGATQLGTYIFRYNETLLELDDGTYDTVFSLQHDVIDLGITKSATPGVVKVAMDFEHGIGWTFVDGTSFSINGQAMLGFLQESDGSGKMSYRFRLGAGKALTVQDHLGNAIFRVDENGDLHGLTGKSLVFDL